MKPKICVICKKVISKGKYCSYQCRDAAKKAKMKKAKWTKQRGITKVKLDKLWADKVKERDGRCCYCGKTKHLNAHHIFSRSNLSTRWELLNGITLCSGCHTFSSTFSAHKTPTEFTFWLSKVKHSDFHLQNLAILAHTRNTKTPEQWYATLEGPK